jgi:hypothetical protein
METNQWEITALAEGRAAFEAGPATVLVNVTLLSE